MKKIQVTEVYLKNILQALEDAKGLCVVLGYKHEFTKHISATKKHLSKIDKM